VKHPEKSKVLLKFLANGHIAGMNHTFLELFALYRTYGVTFFFMGTSIGNSILISTGGAVRYIVETGLTKDLKDIDVSFSEFPDKMVAIAKTYGFTPVTLNSNTGLVQWGDPDKVGNTLAFLSDN
jgi:hypothetical protein